MYIGADYYPEHWPRERWPIYAKWMKKAGFNVVRMAEFAWVFMEPEEGRFDFSWLDDALATLHKQGISAILGTPTAVMPAWVAEKYPETLAMEYNGKRVVWGVRKNNCFSSGTYRLLSERITRAMAEHFRNTPNVIGWQTDNEFGAPPCYCPTCRSDFQDWLRTRHGTLDEVNRAWGTHFWGHRVRTWDEIQIPPDPATYNPGQCLDWQRFFTFQNVRFQHDQVRILREVCPKHFVTHNFMGFVPDLNYFDLAKDLDFVSWDNYPIQVGEPGMMYDAAGAGDLMRGLKRKNYWIMEMSAGPAGWGTFGRNPRPGELRLVALQQVAHGADGLVWFRWRTCTAGREQYWHGLLGHDGRPLRRYREAAQTARDFHKLEKLIAGTTVKADVAILYDYDSLWATRIQPSFQGNDYQAGLRRYQQALVRAGVNVDLISTTDDFSGYRLVIAPQLYVLPDAIAGKLDAYVKAGGVLLADLRTGIKDESGLCHERTLPGLLSKCLGIEIEEYGAISDSTPLAGWGADGRDLHAIQYADWVVPKSAAKLAGYSDWHMEPFAALTRNAYGKGVGYYLGTVIRESEFYDELIAAVIKTARVRPVLKPPVGVEVSVRQGKGRKLLFLMNESEKAQTLSVPAGRLEVLSGRKTKGEITLPRFGVAVISM